MDTNKNRFCIRPFRVHARFLQSSGAQRQIGSAKEKRIEQKAAKEANGTRNWVGFMILAEF